MANSKSLRRESIHAQLERAAIDLVRLQDVFGELKGADQVPPSVRVEVHDLVARYRTILDYAAQEIARICFPAPKRPQFPIASIGQSRDQFVQDLDGRYKGLRHASHTLHDYVIGLQHFGGNPWLATLAALANHGKHDELPEQVKGDFVAGYLGAKGNAPALTIFGTGSFVMADGSLLRIRRPDGRPLNVRGPQTITVDTPEILHADDGVYFRRVAWRDFRFVSEQDQTTIGLIALFDVRVRSVTDRVLKEVDSRLAEIESRVTGPAT